MLRRRIKRRLQRSDEGDSSDRWSARKSRRPVREYERRGGGDKANAGQKGAAAGLRERTGQDRRTRDGSACVRTAGGVRRYLPKRVWGLPTDLGTRETERLESEGARGDASGLREDQLKRLSKRRLVEIARREDLPHRSKMAKAQLARTLRRHFRERHATAGGTKRELYGRAKALGIEGRSRMGRDQLARAVARVAR